MVSPIVNWSTISRAQQMKTIRVIQQSLLLSLSMLLSACVSAGETSLPTANIPASITELTIVSNGKRMSGLIYQAVGKGPHPTAIMLHGYPGNEKNLDLAQALRKAGWNALFFHYRGAWGSEGEFSFVGAEQDVQTVINYVQQAETAKSLRINPEMISLVGHSMGGHMAVAGILDNPSVKCSVAHDGANMGARGKGLFSDEQSIKLWRDYSDTLFMLNGWSGEKAITEITQYGPQLDIVKRAKKINQRAVLLIAADTEVIPIDLHIKPLQRALNEYSNNISYVLIDDDHSFSNSRDKLINSTRNFLDSNCR